MIIAADFCGICGVSVYGSSKGSPFGAIVLTDGRTAPKQGGRQFVARSGTHTFTSPAALFRIKKGLLKSPKCVILRSIYATKDLKKQRFYCFFEKILRLPLRYRGRSRDDATRRLPRTSTSLQRKIARFPRVPPLRYRGRSRASRAYHAQNDRTFFTAPSCFFICRQLADSGGPPANRRFAPRLRRRICPPFCLLLSVKRNRSFPPNSQRYHRGRSRADDRCRESA